MQIKDFTFKLLLFILISSSCCTLLAKEFQVELVFFEHLNNTPSPEGEAHVNNAREDISFLVNFNSVAAEDLQLTDEAQRIRGSRNFRLLKHIAWSQEGLSRDEAGAVNISRWIPKLRGTITLYLNRYLHLDFHIESTDTASDDMGMATEQVYVMHERRRLRSKTTHYIDSPKIGVLARITALEDIEKIRERNAATE